MSVATDLDTVITRLSVAHAGGQTYGKTELGRLRRELRLIQEDAKKQEDLLEGVSSAAGVLAGKLLGFSEGVRP